MKVSVWDTYVKKKDNSIMHFDIIVPEHVKDQSVIFEFGKIYLKHRNEEGSVLTAKECSFCHVQEPKEEWKQSINEKGYYIYEMEGCK